MAVLLALILAVALAGPASGVCVGDCGGDGAVTINELIIGVGIALGSEPVSACAPLDADGDGNVAIAELVTGVANALGGCAAAATPTATGPRPPTATRTAAASPSATPTPTATPARGPDIAFFGVTSADDSYQPPAATDPQGIPIYERSFGFGFSLVVEAQRGPSGVGVGELTIVDGDVPDLQIQATRALGNGSAEVCDVTEMPFGGVPGVDPPRLEDPAAIADPLNDFGCRFIDGTGQSGARTCGLGCVRFESGEYGCQSGDGVEKRQFCAPVPMTLAFPDGDTLVTVRVRDKAGNLGDPARLIVRVTPP